MAENQGQLVLAQNQHAFVQDLTKGTVQVYAGPANSPIGNNERPVVYDRTRDTFVAVTLEQAIKQNPFVAEGHYLVLENPAEETRIPKSGGSNPPVELRVGRKVNIPGPTTFPLWPGQFAEVVPGHHLRSNQYLLVRVYNAEEAAKNAAGTLLTSQFKKSDGVIDETAIQRLFTPGQLLIIKGTETSFFIPPTGFEVIKDQAAGNAYVREALTLERLEYAILLDENGNKRYERGPQVVFPEATETFITRADQADDGKGSRSRKFKAIELNDYMGLYVKVTADYEENGRQYVTGEELFITGKEQRIYYQRAEHALIGYDDPSGATGFKRERYYGVTIPKGEGRYILDKSAGVIKKVEGPRILLPDPRNETITRRVLDAKTVNLWYPGNTEAMAFNATLASQASEDMGYLTYNDVSVADASRGLNRMTASNIGKGDTFTRSGKFTPPPTLTLGAATKYEGVPGINVWTGYAVQVVDKSGKRRVVVGPSNVLLEYDETLEVLELSTGKPKTTDMLRRDVYLRVDNNTISDVIEVETKDMVTVSLKVSYRVNFLRTEQDKWFAVENYVKYLCDDMRSQLKAAFKKQSITEVIADATDIVRDVVLGAWIDGNGLTSDGSELSSAQHPVKRARLFPENGMEVYDVEVLDVAITSEGIVELLSNAQQEAVETVITLTAKEQRLEATRRGVAIDIELRQLETRGVEADEAAQQAQITATAETALTEQALQEARIAASLKAQVTAQDEHNALAQAELARDKARSDFTLAIETAQTGLFKERVQAVTPDLIAALQTVTDTRTVTELAKAIAPLALAEQQGLGATVERVFKGTPIEGVLENLKSKALASK